MPRPLSRELAIERLQSHLWRYLYETASAQQALAAMDGVFDLRPEDRRRLLAAQLVLSPTAVKARKAVDDLLPRLPATASLRKNLVHDRIEGRVDWVATSRARATSWDPTAFVCESPIRRYDTKQARAVAQAAEVLRAASRAAGLLDKGDTGRRVWDLLRWSEEVLHHPKIQSVQVKTLTAAEHRTLSGNRDLRPVLDLLDLSRRLRTASEDPSAMAALAARVLAPVDRPTLLELLVVFGIADLIADAGFTPTAPTRLLSGATPAAVLISGDTEIRIFWRTDYWAVIRHPQRGRLASALSDASLAPRVLRPDVMIDIRGSEGRELVIGEVKYTDSDVAAAEGRGLRDVLAYLHDIQGNALGATLVNRAFVVAWGSRAVPSGGRISVCGFSSLGDLVSALDLVGDPAAVLAAPHGP